MVGDVAVEEPGARVVGLEGDDDDAVGGEEGDVAARGVVQVEGGDGAVEGGGGLGEEDEVVAVEVELWGGSVMVSMFLFCFYPYFPAFRFVLDWDGRWTRTHRMRNTGKQT